MVDEYNLTPEGKILALKILHDLGVIEIIKPDTKDITEKLIQWRDLTLKNSSTN